MNLDARDHLAWSLTRIDKIGKHLAGKIADELIAQQPAADAPDKEHYQFLVKCLGLANALRGRKIA